jgi:hypothetical protein
MEIVLGCYSGYLLFVWGLEHSGLSGRDSHSSSFIDKLIWFLLSPWNFVYHKVLSDRKMETSSTWVRVISFATLVLLIILHSVEMVVVPLWLWLPFVGGTAGFALWMLAW